MTNNKKMKMNKHVVEKTAWGIDLGTAVNLLSLLPKDMPQKLQSEFVEKKLVFSIALQGEDGYDIFNALDFMVESTDIPRFT